MKFTIALPQSNRVSTPSAIRDVAQAADELGFWALSMHDHITFDGRWIGCGSDEDDGTGDVRNVFEQMTTYAHVSALTRRINLLFSIMLMPMREPLLAAKQIATLDQLSGGRVLLGIGVGLAGNDTDPPFVHVLSENAAREWAALKVPARRRGKLTDERLAAMRAVWAEEPASFAGDFVEFTDVAMYPKPARPGGPPIFIGGNSPAALERTARGGFSWLPSHAKPEELAEGLGYLMQLHEKHGTTYSGELVVDMFMRLDESAAVAEESFPAVLREALGAELPLRNLVGNPDELAERAAEYAGAGVTAMDLKPMYHSVDELLAMMQTFAAEVMPATA